jgi:hypothetical protein
MKRDHTQLIETLVADLQPRRRPAEMAPRLAVWFAGALVFIALAALAAGPRPDLLARAERIDEWLGFLAALATGLCAALALAGRRGGGIAWWLPLPALGVWIASLGAGCYGDFVRRGPSGLELGTSFHCTMMILVMSAPLAAGLALAAGRAPALLHPTGLVLGALATASISSAGLSLFHRLDTALMTLVWHLGTVAVIMAVTAVVARGSRHGIVRT